MTNHPLNNLTQLLRPALNVFKNFVRQLRFELGQPLPDNVFNHLVNRTGMGVKSGARYTGCGGNLRNT